MYSSGCLYNTGDGAIKNSMNLLSGVISQSLKEVSYLSSNISPKLRWKHGFLVDQHFNNFGYFFNSDERNILFVTGLGFDPRMCSGIEHRINFGGKGKRDCYLLIFDKEKTIPPTYNRAEIQKNGTQIKKNLMIEEK